MTDASAPSLRARLLAALVRTGQGSAVIAAHGEPLSVVEVPDEGAGIVILDHGGLAPDELRARLDRLLAGHEAGLLVVVLAGGGEEVRPILAAADRQAPDPNRLGTYHLDAGGHLRRVAGRRSGLLEQAARAVPTAQPISDGEIAELVARGQAERQEAAAFATAIAQRRSVITYGILTACVVLYVLASQWGRGDPTVANFLLGANSAPLVAAGQLWRLLASAFLHASVLHLAVNLIALHGIGVFLEAVLGWRRYLLLYAGAALGGGLASVFVGGVQHSVGASGALWGLLGAGFALSLRKQTLLPARLARRLRQRLLVVLVLNAMVSFLPRIDLWAHFGGGLAGFALVYSGLLLRGWGRADGPALKASALVAGALLAGSVLVGLALGKPWLAPAVEEAARAALSLRAR